MKLLKRALEDFNVERLDEENQVEDEDKDIVMEGPLSEIIYRALNVAYSKQKDYALESQSQDATIIKSVAEQGQRETLTGRDYVVYGVSRQHVRPEDIVEIKQINKELKDPSRMLVVISQKGANGTNMDAHTPVQEYQFLDYDNEGDNYIAPYQDSLANALESYLQASQIKSTNSLKDVIDFIQ